VSTAIPDRTNPPSSAIAPISLGLAMIRPGEEPVAALSRADRALYLAKVSGRNRVVLDDAPEAEVGDRSPG